MNKESKDKLNTSFASAANSLTGFFKASIILQEESFKQGQIDAYKEIIEFCLKVGQGDVTSINTHEMIAFLRQKIRDSTNRPSSTTQSASQALRLISASTGQSAPLVSNINNIYSNNNTQFRENYFSTNNNQNSASQQSQPMQVLQQQNNFSLGINASSGFGGLTTTKASNFPQMGGSGFVNIMPQSQNYIAFTSPDLNMMKNIESKQNNPANIGGPLGGTSERIGSGLSQNIFSSSMSQNIEYARNQPLRMESSKY